MHAQDRPVLFFPGEQSFRDWLVADHALADGRWWQGLMHPAGQTEIDRAEAVGRWDVAYATRKFADGQMSGR